MADQTEFEVLAMTEGRIQIVARFKYWLEALDYVTYALRRGALKVWARGGAYTEPHEYTLADFPNLNHGRV